MLPTSGSKLILQPLLSSKASLVKRPNRKLLLSKSIQCLLLELQTIVLLGIPELFVQVCDEDEAATESKWE